MRSRLTLNCIEFAAGAEGFAGCIARSATAPFDRTRILFQSGAASYPTNESLYTVIRYVYQKEGIAAFWKGNVSTIIRVFPYASLQFFFFDYYNYFFRHSFGDWAVRKNLPSFLAGALAAGTATILTHPLDVIRARMAVQPSSGETRYTGVWQALSHLYVNEGRRGLARGIAPTLVGVLPYGSVMFGVNDTLRRAYTKRFGPPTPLGQPKSIERGIPIWVRLMTGAIAGLVAQTVTYPFDTIRRRMQIQGFQGEQGQKSSLAMARAVIADGGIRGLFRGISAAPMVSIAFTVNDLLKKVFGVAEMR